MLSTITHLGTAPPGASVIEVVVDVLLLGAAICLCAFVVLAGMCKVSRLRRRAGSIEGSSDTTTTRSHQPPAR
ncbi:MAG: hypothetical protein M0Z42_05465 [Actinomycetota bacterium]|jgi:hypothetical protein|nr:hypothetical protein [Actinomycetota bacterium]